MKPRLLRLVGQAALGAVALLGLGLTQAQAAGKPVFDAPYDVEIFVRGSFNIYGTGHEMKFDATNNEYVAFVELAWGTHLFKIASEDWYTVDLGAADDGVVEVGVPEPITRVSYNDLSLDIVDPGVYSFTLDVSDPDHLTVTVEYARKGGDGTQTYVYSYPGYWEFEDTCVAGPLVGVYTIKGLFHESGTPWDGRHNDAWRIDAIAYDQNSVEYRLNGTGSIVWNGQKKGESFTYTRVDRLTFISQGGTPNLYAKFTWKGVVDPTGEVRREFQLYADGCR